MAEKTTDKPRAVRSHDVALDKEYIQWIQDIKICLLMLKVKNCNKLLQKFMGINRYSSGKIQTVANDLK